jgi:hypothetical protein
MENLYLEGAVNKIYEESSQWSITESKENPSNIREMVKDIVDDLGLSTKFVTTFGTGIGAFMEPVTKLLEGSGVYLDKESIVLLIITAISFIISDTDFNKLKEEVRNKGLLNHLKGVVTFVKGSTNIMKSVLNKVSSASYGLTDILGFTFILVPVMNVLSGLINDYGITSETVSQLLTGLTAGAATYGVKSVIKRLKNKL